MLINIRKYLNEAHKKPLKALKDFKNLIINLNNIQGFHNASDPTQPAVDFYHHQDVILTLYDIFYKHAQDLTGTTINDRYLPLDNASGCVRILSHLIRLMRTRHLKETSLIDSQTLEPINSKSVIKAIKEASNTYNLNSSFDAKTAQIGKHQFHTVKFVNLNKDTQNKDLDSALHYQKQVKRINNKKKQLNQQLHDIKRKQRELNLKEQEGLK